MNQLSFSDVFPASWDLGLAQEVFKVEGETPLRDNNEIFMQQHRARIDAWLSAHPNSAIYEIRDNYAFYNF